MTKIFFQTQTFFAAVIFANKQRRIRLGIIITIFLGGLLANFLQFFFVLLHVVVVVFCYSQSKYLLVGTQRFFGGAAIFSNRAAVYCFGTF
jgi:hypothetical protein